MPSAVKHKTRTVNGAYLPYADEYLSSGCGSHNSWGAVGTASYPQTQFIEDITYTGKPKTERLQSNQCRHTKSYYSCPGFPYQNVTHVPSGLCAHFNSHNGYSILTSPDALNAFITATGHPCGYGVIGALGQGYINDAFAKLKPDLTTVSIPNFLLELDDIPALFQFWKKELSLAKNLAGARLNWKFGWAPLVSDLTNILHILASVRDQCIAWNNLAKTAAIKHVSAKMLTYSDAKSGSMAYAGPGTCFWSGTLTGTLTAHLKFRLMPILALNEAEMVLRAYLDALGFELNPRIIWDALPFSFVLDWFFDVGGWVQRFKVDTLELPIVLVDSCLQYKEEIRVQHYWQSTGSVYSPQLKSVTAETMKDTFQRVPIFPDLSAATANGWKIPSTNQLINGLALATVLWK